MPRASVVGIQRRHFLGQQLRVKRCVEFAIAQVVRLVKEDVHLPKRIDDGPQRLVQRFVVKISWSWKRDADLRQLGEQIRRSGRLELDDASPHDDDDGIVVGRESMGRWAIEIAVRQLPSVRKETRARWHERCANVELGPGPSQFAARILDKLLDTLFAAGRVSAHMPTARRVSSCSPTAGSAAWSFDIQDGRIRAIYVNRNPDKLRTFLERTH